jgi:hypothetical protein
LDTDSVPVLPERVWIICIKKATSFENPNTWNQKVLITQEIKNITIQESGSRKGSYQY